MKGFKILLAFLLIITGCREAAHKTTSVGFDGIKERKIDISDTKVLEGFIKGTDFNRGEVYIHSQPKSGKHLLKIANIDTGKVEKKLVLERGPMESPIMLYNPNYVEYLHHRYFIIDQYQKVIVFNEQLKYLYTNMFEMYRYFIDFYIKDNQTFLVVGDKFFGMKNRKNTIRLFQFDDNRRPKFVKKLACFYNKSLSIKNRQTTKYYYKGYFWPSGKGFEKQGKIYYAAETENKYYVYDLNSEETRVMELSYLQPRKYSNADARKIGIYKSNGWEKKIFRRSGKRVVYLAYPETIYHFGIYDVGHNKIGVVGDIELETYKFRLDIIETTTNKYIESIWLPSGAGFIDNLSTSARGVLQSFFNIDKGFYVWHDEVGEDFTNCVMITKFSIRRDTESPKQVQ